jgi:hypothetical protein
MDIEAVPVMDEPQDPPGGLEIHVPLLLVEPDRPAGPRVLDLPAAVRGPGDLRLHESLQKFHVGGRGDGVEGLLLDPPVDGMEGVAGRLPLDQVEMVVQIDGADPLGQAGPLERLDHAPERPEVPGPGPRVEEFRGGPGVVLHPPADRKEGRRDLAVRGMGRVEKGVVHIQVPDPHGVEDLDRPFRRVPAAAPEEDPDFPAFGYYF